MMMMKTLLNFPRLLTDLAWSCIFFHPPQLFFMQLICFPPIFLPSLILRVPKLGKRLPSSTEDCKIAVCLQPCLNIAKKTHRLSAGSMCAENMCSFPWITFEHNKFGQKSVFQCFMMFNILFLSFVGLLTK